MLFVIRNSLPKHCRQVAVQLYLALRDAEKDFV